MKLPKPAHNALWVAFILLTAIVLLQNALIVTQIKGLQGTTTGLATDTARTELCMNDLPYWPINISCPFGFMDVPYTCNVSARDDSHPIADYQITILNGTTNATGLFMVDAEGILAFTPNSTQVDTYLLHITATDSHICPVNASTTFPLTILYANQAPILLRPIPNSTWQQDTILVPYNLNDYFIDPEGGPLLFRVDGNSRIRITITAAGEVTLFPQRGWCGEELVVYTATDIEGLSTESNIVTLTVQCPPDDGGDAGMPSGGGGGGGGGFTEGTGGRCQEIYYCYEWSECQYTRAVTGTGENLSLNITGVRGSRMYLLEEPLQEPVDVFYQGYMWRECVDTSGCSLKSKYYARACEYQPSCFDGIQNQDETGIDCGGVCRPCGTCFDGIQNGYETGVDCGGPDCPPCHTCFDGIMNGLELGVDCGGPDCPPCPSCFDGIQNQGEEDIDCGGPCPACVREETPLDTTISWLDLVLLTIAALLLVLVLTLFLGRWMRSLLAAWALKHQRRNRIILLDHNTREALTQRAWELEERLGEENLLKLQADIARLARHYFSAALGLEFECTAEDVAQVVARSIHPDLQPVLNALFAETRSLETARDPQHRILLRSIITELRSVIDFTSVFTAQDLKVREQTQVTYVDPTRQSEREDQAYTALHQTQLAMEYDNLLVAERNYGLLHSIYVHGDHVLQHALHAHIERAYLELKFANAVERTLWRRMK